MNIDQALALGHKRLTGSDSPDLDARLLLEYVTQANYSQLIAHPEKELNHSERRVYQELLLRAAAHEPIPYLLGSAPFYGSDFIVNPAVLIPRPETELIIDSVVDWARKNINESDNFYIVDVGTGSGCIAITLAGIFPNAQIEAIDISADSLEVAKANAIKYQVCHRINFLHGDLLIPITSNPNLIVANLPYVADDEWSTLDQSVRLFEPEIALRGGSDGVDMIEDLLVQARDRLAPGGGIFLEIGWQQGPMVLQVATSLFPRATIRVRADLSNKDRIVTIETIPKKV
ncbi:MAG: peptide chain release factor N(5)-glutamine methyltransferase [Anaerolineae bacterium]|nr:MAG: peptide chain release factor N(5)-glutamine methyltransferase [Anaerolineae bacterium]